MSIAHDNHDQAKQDDVASTVSEIMHDLPVLSVQHAGSIKSGLTSILNKFYERAAAEGRYLEITEPSTPASAAVPDPSFDNVVIPVPKPKVMRNRKVVTDS